jgi:hypothetical protein
MYFKDMITVSNTLYFKDTLCIITVSNTAYVLQRYDVYIYQQ